MKGSKPQSFSVAGSVPSSAPNHSSISGPLYPLSTLFLQPDQASDSVHCPSLPRVIVNAPRMVEVHNAHKRVERSHDSRRPLRRCGEAGSRVLKDPWEGSRPHVAGRDRGCGDESPKMRPQPYQARLFRGGRLGICRSSADCQSSQKHLAID